LAVLKNRNKNSKVFQKGFDVDQILPVFAVFLCWIEYFTYFDGKVRCLTNKRHYL